MFGRDSVGRARLWVGGRLLGRVRIVRRGAGAKWRGWRSGRGWRRERARGRAWGGGVQYSVFSIQFRFHQVRRRKPRLVSQRWTSWASQRRPNLTMLGGRTSTGRDLAAPAK